MITGVWISPDGEELAIQIDEDSIFVLPAGTMDLVDAEDGVPGDWQTLRDSAVTPAAWRS